MLRKIPLALVGLTVGSILTVIGFVAYGTGNSTLNLAGFFYGIPLLLGGLALKAAELKPIPFLKETTPEVLALRKEKATATQNQLRLDVTRYRYGQEAHLDEALQRLGLSPTDDERPILTKIQEDKIDNHYALILYFDSPLIKLETWQEKQEKITKFFGPGIEAKISLAGENEIELALITSS
ncbi:DUF2854 domain-containing protein [Cyanobacterium aponinum UTEX 3222]|uniref:Thylakoid membrane protein n=1 Tax=Cyanobacterium aponinum (strain PCC 10605) TaxID=755178 RepID=K9Z5Q5_CYAAP|nr:DUF2854 domain-containing protein [Cyanobacterium aponinum]WRL41397.1 DUF2854 domain-containing protein [Cyanobacterium aponinum UTEX 3222]AFZ53703.1 hypothetical protein Cyan10605_1595 [Cyanobacterium aponinum PCC 10605]MBD2393493.1 DUF2854 domain-containing protein [Cyanobacterium aponinum FACHB-4101]PHV62238.1 DUF2854 domain-containing protein [Cyanobacterium aponinum IPPAS B-1201]WRL38124.1 DUF2854 domain-containing protein [Cyanobacterium aponinum UTEX 3221]